MTQPNTGAGQSFRGDNKPLRQRPTLLPSPTAPYVDPSLFSLPPPTMGMNNYPVIPSNAGQPPMPNFSRPPLPMGHIPRPNNTPQHSGNVMVPNFAQPPPMRHPPSYYPGQISHTNQLPSSIPTPVIGAVPLIPNATQNIPPLQTQGFSGHPPVGIPPYSHHTALPEPSNTSYKFSGPPPNSRPMPSQSRKGVTHGPLASNDSDRFAISGQDQNNPNRQSGGQGGNRWANADKYGRSHPSSGASYRSRLDAERNSSGVGNSYDTTNKMEGYKREDCASDRLNRNDRHGANGYPSDRKRSRERDLSGPERYSKSRHDFDGEGSRKYANYSSRDVKNRESGHGASHRSNSNPRHNINQNENWPSSQGYKSYQNSHHQGAHRTDIIEPETKRKRIEGINPRRTPSLEQVSASISGSNSRSRSSSIGRNEQNRRSLSPERRPSRRRKASNDPAARPASTENEKKNEDIDEKKLNDYLKLTPDEIIDQEKKIWTRSSPADLYYERDMQNPVVLKATPRLQQLLDRFEDELIKRGEASRAKFPAYKPYRLSVRDVAAKCRSGKGCCGGPADKSDTEDDEMDDAADDSCDDSHEDTDEKPKLGDSHGKGSECTNKSKESKSNKGNGAKKTKHDPTRGKIKNELLDFMKNRQEQPYRLDPELWDNQPGELNDGPACRCSLKARKFGIRHGIYQGEDTNTSDRIPLDPMSNNGDRLYHYRVTISPPTNFLVKTPTVIPHDGHEFIFEGFSLFTTQPLKTTELPVCNIVRFSIKYSVLYFQEKMPDNITVRELELFHKYFFNELLELHDFDLGSNSHQFLFMPRFVRDLSENGKEILSMNEVISYLLKSGTKKLMDEMDLLSMTKMPPREWQDNVVEKIRGQLVTYPGMRPSTLRVDQLDKEQDNPETIQFPQVVHFGSSPPQLCYAGNGEYMKAWRDCVKFRHLLANMPKVKDTDRQKLSDMEEKLNEIRSNIKTKRVVVVAISAQNFFKTGLMTDIVQHGLLLPSLVSHLRFHASLDYFENEIKYKFKNRHLLQLAMTHPSYKENFGTNPDHARNALSHCGIRQPEFGDKKVHTAGTRKRGINMLISIMSKFGKQKETESKVGHNERLEFLGDAVVEFITSVHLFYMFPDLEEGGLATYRAALVQNQHLAILAERLGLEKYMLYAHGNDLCHDAELRHAMANCFEALMGAIYLDSGINEADRVFASALFGSGGSEDDKDLHETWAAIPLHPLQAQEPEGDRRLIPTYPPLQKLVTFEDATGLEFTHIRLLARSFSDRSLSNCNLTMGSNQRLEFLGDTVLQLVTSDYLYRHFPEHHEGHLSLLRSSMVNNRTQAIVCDDLGIPNYAMFSNPRKELKMKDRADLLEALIGAIYVDKDLDYCRTFAEVCFFPRLYQFIINQDWNDPKSKLQQCCLTLRTMDSGEPDIPIYKVIACKGPTNTRVYTVAVYFRGQRLASADGPSIQAAEMNAAKFALKDNSHLFPHLQHQKRIMERSFMNQGIVMKKLVWEEEVRNKRRQMGLDEIHDECSKRNDEKIRKALEQRKSQCTLQENPKSVGDIDNICSDNNVETIEPEPEKSHKKPEELFDMKKIENRYPDKTSYRDSFKGQNLSFEPRKSGQNTKLFRSKHYDIDAERQDNINQEPGFDAFKTQYQNNVVHNQSASFNRNINHSKWKNQSNLFNGPANVCNLVSKSSDLSSPLPEENPSSSMSVGTALEKDGHKSKDVHQEPVAVQEKGRLSSLSGNKEEGELSDEELEIGPNRQNAVGIDHYAEPISSPE